MIAKTGCDAVAIGRAAQGNPWIFTELCEREAGREFIKPSLSEVKEMILRHGRMLIECKGEYIGSREMRKHAAWYTAGYPGSSKLRGQLNLVENYDQLYELLMRWE